ncbi:phosphatidylinositol-binding clathrin assembly protein-like isoform X4 [Elysia marginata]|uniref:Phosphatidylinositol-binding clathrin assembly protein-like isoform X4 n=1 Tax=Elysia marginata TaxID=1093978 RepID=A0AAV4FMP1_9GAST|nr:phosphatidylinositol-binding clathrin assembly protein-like isoform X4 [Elysia marginata]
MFAAGQGQLQASTTPALSNAPPDNLVHKETALSSLSKRYLLFLLVFSLAAIVHVAAATHTHATRTGQDLVSTALDPLDGTGGQAVPADLGMPAVDLTAGAPPPVALTPSPIPTPSAAPPTAFDLDDPFAGLDGGSDPIQSSGLPGLSPAPGGFPPAPAATDSAADLFGVGGSSSTASPGLFLGSMVGSTPAGASQPLPPTHSSGLFNPVMGQGSAQGYYQPAMNVPVVPAGGMNTLPTMAAAAAPVAPGSPSLGMAGSPARIMTRGGKAPASPSLSASHSGPGLEDAVKALGLAMSPAKTGPASKAAVNKPQSRPLSPGQPIMGSSYSTYDSAEGLGSGVGPNVLGSYVVEGSGLVGEQLVGQAGMPDQEADLSGQGMKQSSKAASSSNPSGFDAFGDVLQPMNKPSGAEAPQPSQQAKPLGSDLDTSLASLASNLNVGGGAAALKKDHQWQPKGESKLTGGNSFQRQPMAQSTTTGVPQWGAAQPGFQQPNMMGAPGAPMMYQQPMGAPMGQPMMGMVQPMGMMGGMHPMQPGMQPAMQPGMGMGGMMGGMQAGPPGMFNPQQPAMMGAFQPQRPPAPSNSGTSAVNDPFGAL